MNLGEKIIAIRMAAGLSQRAFAKEMKCTQSLISDYEANKKSPSFEKLNRIAAFAKVNKVKIKLLED